MKIVRIILGGLYCFSLSFFRCRQFLTACGICCRVLCETVKAFVAKVAQAHENDSEKDSKDIATKVHCVYGCVCLFVCLFFV